MQALPRARVPRDDGLPLVRDPDALDRGRVDAATGGVPSRARAFHARQRIREYLLGIVFAPSEEKGGGGRGGVGGERSGRCRATREVTDARSDGRSRTERKRSGSRARARGSIRLGWSRDLGVGVIRAMRMAHAPGLRIRLRVLDLVRRHRRQDAGAFDPVQDESRRRRAVIERADVARRRRRGRHSFDSTLGTGPRSRAVQTTRARREQTARYPALVNGDALVAKNVATGKERCTCSVRVQLYTYAYYCSVK